MIPDEAVHAGFIELYERPHVEGVSAADIRRVLEAAAPHLMAQAWHEGYDRAELDHSETGFWTTRLRNSPYRNPTDAD